MAGFIPFCCCLFPSSSSSSSSSSSRSSSSSSRSSSSSGPSSSSSSSRSSSSSGSIGPCVCVAPARDGAPGEITFGTCLRNGVPCDSTCEVQWDDGLGQWNFLAPGCAANAPDL